MSKESEFFIKSDNAHDQRDHNEEVGVQTISGVSCENLFGITTAVSGAAGCFSSGTNNEITS